MAEDKDKVLIAVLIENEEDDFFNADSDNTINSVIFNNFTGSQKKKIPEKKKSEPKVEQKSAEKKQAKKEPDEKVKKYKGDIPDGDF